MATTPSPVNQETREAITDHAERLSAREEHDKSAAKQRDRIEGKVDRLDDKLDLLLTNP